MYCIKAEKRRKCLFCSLLLLRRTSRFMLMKEPKRSERSKRFLFSCFPNIFASHSIWRDKASNISRTVAHQLILREWICVRRSTPRTVLRLSANRSDNELKLSPDKHFVVLFLTCRPRVCPLRPTYVMISRHLSDCCKYSEHCADCRACIPPSETCFEDSVGAPAGDPAESISEASAADSPMLSAMSTKATSRLRQIVEQVSLALANKHVNQYNQTV